MSVNTNSEIEEKMPERNMNNVRVVFIGNSITLRGDSVRLVTEGIEAETGRRADVRVRDLSGFESSYRDFDYEGIRDLRDFNPDYLIVALGEKVPDLESQEECIAFREAFKKLLACFMRECEMPTCAVCGVFRENAWQDAMMEHAASDFSIPFVKADGLGENAAEFAGRLLEGLFPKNSGYRAWLDGRELFVRPIRISAMPFNL